MQRHDTFDLLGELSARKYSQPSGYKLARAETPRIQQIRRSLASALHDGDLTKASRAARSLSVAQGKREATQVRKVAKKATPKKRAGAKR
jgi:hypothetical protein